ncbi:MAG TPA: tRNA uridine-5-carboxymethylaminomethyl(34) synthesis GTPase MnmE [Flavobacteriales bacterium]|nr:tRNA uridine-5-carboxymethylaminomethyl(34) synthesis GTPase MnmE [Flavobacteriales bacterium]
MSANDTIAAISTPPGNAGIGIVRVSGPGVPKLITKLFKETLKPREASLRKVYDLDGQAIDNAIAIYYKEPESYTGEEVLEIHAHGNPVILETILNNITKKEARLAKPGEFTEKAFLNNKIDLTQAEAVSDLITSRNLSAVKGAYNSMQGVFSKKIIETTEKLLELRARIEAAINFPEDDVPESSKKEIKKELAHIKERVEKIIIGTNIGIELNKQNTYCVVGQPNTGKSSMINLLLGDDASIVSSIPGTTRDSIQYEVKFGDCSFMIIDTAGLRKPENQIEKAGIKKTKDALSKANRVMYMVDDQIGFSDEDDKIINKFEIKNYDLIFNKIDLTKKDPSIQHGDIGKIYISVRKNKGIEYVRDLIKKHNLKTNVSENTVTARGRHLEAAKNALQSLYNAQKYLDNDELELIAEELKSSHEQLFLITGGNSSDELLAKIFSEFCIGK